ncbi:aminoglycoside phosphotransferase family protein [Oscillochloris sp. ZM17-4]|uniref:aminoglycoside phosphotransferase family protein n=1 Tax=Oscillochloris sp. ZM17-4 TaxID=2866714 RepID=UPI001C738537|nr:aminoglycoside phosphotransferase family protein [Oscillochloris sp. ZM17-4]MBX0327624.1 aminoglycoside phosphotransferase family protein [Oscillochloris sp. ZM17-4]
MDIPAAFRHQMIATFAEDGTAWLSRLPALIDAYARRWALSVGPAFANLSYNYVAPASRADGSPAVLKLGVPRDELRTEIDALRHFGDGSCVRLLEADVEGGALLIERAEPGHQLANLVAEDDGRATAIAADTMRRLWKAPPADHRFPRVADWFAGLAKLRARFAGGTGPFPSSLVERAERLCADLLTSSGEPMLLHGDLHHFNILSAGREPWLIIDPKGIIGDPAFEPAALMLNPWPSLLTLPQPGRVMRRRLDILTAELGLDRERIRAWASAFAILSAWWSFDDNSGGWGHSLACADLLAQP